MIYIIIQYMNTLFKTSSKCDICLSDTSNTNLAFFAFQKKLRKIIAFIYKENFWGGVSSEFFVTHSLDPH